MGSFIHVYTDGGGIREARVPENFQGIGTAAFIVDFVDFKRCLLASLVASSTASRTSNIVTITATAHGVPTGSNYVGFRFFYPGSASLAAGWYDSIVSIPDANTITFNAQGANFGSESVNSAAAYTTQTVVPGYAVIPAGILNDFNRVRVTSPVGGGTTAATKTWRPALNSNLLSGIGGTTSAFSVREADFISMSPTSLGMFVVGGNLNGVISATVDKEAPINVTMALTVSAAGDFATILASPMIFIM